MGAKKIYECKPCVQYFKGKVAFDYHMNAHRRTALPKSRELPPKPARVCYDDPSGNEPAELKEQRT